MSVDPADIASHLIDIPHDEQLVAKRLERLEHPLVALLLERSRYAQAKEHVECPHRNILRSGARCRVRHFLQQRQSDRDAAQPLEHRSSIHWFTLHRQILFVFFELNRF